MKTKQIIFLTGATGSLGSYLLKVMLQNGHKVYVLARSKTNISARERILNLLSFWKLSISQRELNNRLNIIEGDIALPLLGTRKVDLNNIICDANIFFHSAALAEFRVPLEKIRAINLTGVKNVLHVCSMCRQIQKFNHVSTIYVAGTKVGDRFSEEKLSMGQNFNNTYEQSKFEAEQYINQLNEKNYKITIFRPSMIIGDSISGRTTSFKLIYDPIHFFSQNIYKYFPGDASCLQNLINVDVASQIIYSLGILNESSVYHVISPNSIKIGYILDIAADYFGFQLPSLIPINKFDFSKWTPVQRKLADPFIPYFNYSTNFVSNNSLKKIRNLGLKLPNINKADLKRAFSYCVERNFIKKHE